VSSPAPDLQLEEIEWIHRTGKPSPAESSRLSPWKTMPWRAARRRCHQRARQQRPRTKAYLLAPRPVGRTVTFLPLPCRCMSTARPRRLRRRSSMLDHRRSSSLSLVLCCVSASLRRAQSTVRHHRHMSAVRPALSRTATAP
jgi:hypothetical protein